MPSQNISFRVEADLLDKIRSRDPAASRYPGATAKREVSRWYDMLEEYSRDMPQLTPSELVVWIYYVNTYDGRPSVRNVLDAGTVLLEQQIGLDVFYDDFQTQLALHLNAVPAMAVWALWDAAERYQALVSSSAEELTYGMALHRVGLHTYNLPVEDLRIVEATRAVSADLLPGAYMRAMEGEDDDG